MLLKWDQRSSAIAAVAASFTMLLLMVQLSVAAPRHVDADLDDEIEDDNHDHMHPDLSIDDPYRVIDGRKSHFAEVTNEYWQDIGKEFLREQSHAQPNTNIAKNMIMLMGDGMGLTTISAARYELGGEEQQLAFESFPYTGLSRTYSIDKITPDSASTSTALLCGVKTNHGTIGVNGKVRRQDCNIMATNKVDSIGKWALDAGKDVGIVTTTTVTHASPAGMYAQISERRWENDAELRKTCGSSQSQIADIAQQLIYGEVGSRLSVVLGGGRRHLIDQRLYANGSRSDGRNLIEEFRQQSNRNAYIKSRKELLNFDVNSSDRLLGLFADGHFQYRLDAIASGNSEQPTLDEMTRTAIKFLQAKNNPNGYLLFVEGGLIDFAHHENKARLALDETIEFSNAVDTAKALTNDADTLLVVTADHSHTFSVAGYQSRSSDIYGVNPTQADDLKNYLPLSYANGPSFGAFYNVEKANRRHPEKAYIEGPHEIFPSTVPLISETHGGEDVPVYATGPWSQLFTGVYEQSSIPYLMAYAACLGNGAKAC